MRIIPPSFWYRKAGSSAPLLERFLTPASLLYSFAHQLHQGGKTPFKAAMPVICIGNAVTGGSGKTPSAISLCSLIQQHKIFRDPAFLTRGYGGSETGPIFVQEQSFQDVGDESLLLSRHAPTILSRKRPDGARFAARHSHDLLILDDGLQNRSLHKDITFMVIDGASGFGNGKTIPAGPLREPLDYAFRKADAFILIGKDTSNIVPLLPPDKPLFNAHVRPCIPEGLDLSARHIAFAGLGRPEKFYHLLKDLKANLAGWRPFPDHYAYTQEDIHKLVEEAKFKGAELLTTEKDHVRLKDLNIDRAVHTLPIKVVFENEQAIIDFLKRSLKV